MSHSASRAITTQAPKHEMNERDGAHRQSAGNAMKLALLFGGGVLAVYGLKRRSSLGVALTALGGTLFATGLAQEGPTRTARSGRAWRKGRKFVRAVTINRPVEEIYGFWRNLENLPKFMSHLKTVKVIDEGRSHWVASAPLGASVEWEAEIIRDVPNEVIAWQSVEPADIGNAGSVHFEEAPEGRGTRLKVVLEYHPPVANVSHLLAQVFGEEPEQQVREDLRRLKQFLETGTIAAAHSGPNQPGPAFTGESPRSLRAGGQAS